VFLPPLTPPVYWKTVVYRLRHRIDTISIPFSLVIPVQLQKFFSFMKFDNVSTPNKTIMNTCHVMLVFLLLFGVLSSTSLSATLPAELPLTMKRFFGKLPQRGQARAVTSAGSRYDTCRLPEWLPSMQIMNTTVYLGAGAFTGTQACGMCIAYRYVQPGFYSVPPGDTVR